MKDCYEMLNEIVTFASMDALLSSHWIKNASTIK